MQRIRTLRLAIVTTFALLSTTAAAAATPPPTPPVEWIISSSDSLASAVTRAASTQSPRAVAASLDEMGEVAATGAIVDFPGLKDASPSVVVAVTGAAADAVATGRSQPSLTRTFDLAPDAGHAVAPDATIAPSAATGRAMAIPAVYRPDQKTTKTQFAGYSTGYTYVQDNWIYRGLWSGLTFAWTDKITMKWVTSAYFTSSTHSITMYYAPYSGFFSNPWVDIDAFRSTNTFIGTLASGSRGLATSGYTIKRVSYPSVSGFNTWTLATLWVTARTGGQWYDAQRTGTATCYSGAQCKY